MSEDLNQIPAPEASEQEKVVKAAPKSSLLPILLIVLAVVIIGGGAYLWWNNSQTEETATNTVASSSSSSSSTSVSSSSASITSSAASSSSSSVASATAGWKTYTNSTYGFSFKYPSDWVVATDAPEREGWIAAFKSTDYTPVAGYNSTLSTGQRIDIMVDASKVYTWAITISGEYGFECETVVKDNKYDKIDGVDAWIQEFYGINTGEGCEETSQTNAYGNAVFMTDDSNIVSLAYSAEDKATISTVLDLLIGTIQINI